MLKMTTLVRAFERKARKVVGSIPIIRADEFSSEKKRRFPFVAFQFSVDCSLTGKASHCECEECEFKSRLFTQDQ